MHSIKYQKKIASTELHEQQQRELWKDNGPSWGEQMQ